MSRIFYLIEIKVALGVNPEDKSHVEYDIRLSLRQFDVMFSFVLATVILSFCELVLGHAVILVWLLDSLMTVFSDI